MTFGGKVCLFKLQKGSKIDLLSKICIFSENIQKIKIFKRSKKNLTVLKMKQKPFSCSIGIWNYHLAPSKSESRIFLWPYASPLCTLSKYLDIQFPDNWKFRYQILLFPYSLWNWELSIFQNIRISNINSLCYPRL